MENNTCNCELPKMGGNKNNRHQQAFWLVNNRLQKHQKAEQMKGMTVKNKDTHPEQQSPVYSGIS